MNKQFYDATYELLSHYLNFPDVADTYKSIVDGIHLQNNFPQNQAEFLSKRWEIIAYIQKVRVDNVIDKYQRQENPLLLIPVPSGKRLDQTSPTELYNNLTAEIPRLICKGLHQLIKHNEPCIEDNQLTAEILQEKQTILQKYQL